MKSIIETLPFEAPARDAQVRVLRKRLLIPALAPLFMLLTVAVAAQDPALLAKAQAGDPVAENSLGDYYYALNTQAGYTQAAGWYRKAADQGYPKAQYSLGISYCWHEGVPQDYQQAYFWIDLAIDGKISDRNHWLNYAASHLTKDQIAQAQGQAQDWLRSHAEKPGP